MATKKVTFRHKFERAHFQKPKSVNEAKLKDLKLDPRDDGSFLVGVAGYEFEVQVRAHDHKLFQQTLENSMSKGGPWSVMYAILNFWRIRLRDSEIAKMAYQIWKANSSEDTFFTLYDSLATQFSLRNK